MPSPIDGNAEAVAFNNEKGFDVSALSPAEKSKLLKKLDCNLLPLITLLYLFVFLDRLNIGNARVAGMAADLHLVGLRYNTAAAVFYIFYILAEIPSNIVLKLVRPSRWLPTITVAWGLVMTLMCLVNSYQGLIISRIFLGLAEAGLFPGVNYYLSLWYPRAYRAKRIALFFSAATTAGACGGILAYIIEKMEGIGGLHGWQWIFCLEGLGMPYSSQGGGDMTRTLAATIVLAFMALFLLHDYPETAQFLSDSERRILIELLRNDSQNLATHFEFKFVAQAFKDYKTYVQGGILLGVVIPAYALSLFIPTIVNELGFSAANAQLLSIPPFATACMATIIVGVYSDIFKTRGPFMIAGALVSLVGFIVLYTQKNAGISYVGAILATVGVFSTVPVNIVWAGSNAGGDIKRGVVIAMTIGMANLGAFCSSFVYFDPPRFHIGHGTMMGCLGWTILLSTFAMWDYNRANMQKEEQCLRCGITPDRRDEFRNMGDDSPLFRYTL